MGKRLIVSLLCMCLFFQPILASATENELNSVTYTGGVVSEGEYKEPTRKGYTFEGWYKDEACSDGNEFDHENDVGSLTEDITVYAKWNTIEYSITYETNGGTLPADTDISYTVENHVTLPIPTKEGSEFAGWYRNEDFSDSPVTTTEGKTENQTFYAKWAEIVTYAAVYDGTQLVFGKAGVIPETYTYINNSGIETIGTLTEGWTGIDTVMYEMSIVEDDEGDGSHHVSSTPWYETYCEQIEAVNVINEISPISTKGWFFRMYNCRNLDLAKLDMSNVTDTSYMFATTGGNVEHFEIKGISNWDVSNVTNMAIMFSNAARTATSLVFEDISNWNVSNVTNMSYLFNNFGANLENDIDLTEFDLSKWNVCNVTDMTNMLQKTGGSNLTTIKTPYNISSDVIIERITSKPFYDITDNNKKYQAGTFPVGITESHTLSKIKPVSYAAVYDGTQLVLGKAVNIPETYTYIKDGVEVVGTLTESWRDIESLSPSSKDDVPWIANYASTITNVEVVDEISPIRTLCWFIDMRYCETMNLAKLDMSNVENMSRMFYNTGYNASSFTITGLSEWDVSSATNMYSMFYNTGRESTKLDIGDISNWNVSNVTNMGSMFRQTGTKATNFTELDLSGWSVSNVTDMTKMLYKTGNNCLTTIYTPYNISSTADITDITSKKFYDKKDDYKEYLAGTFPIGNTESHTLVTTRPTAYAAVYDGTQFVMGRADENGAVPVTYNYIDDEGNQQLGVLSDSWTSIESLNAESEEDIPWYTNYCDTITDVNIVDKISPINTGLWFFELREVTDMDLTHLDVSNVTDMYCMFYATGAKSSSLNIKGLDTWDVSNVTNMSGMFEEAGFSARIWDIGNLSSWDVSNVTDMSYMFRAAGDQSFSFSIKGLDTWNVSNVTNMYSMFLYAGFEATTWSIGNLSNWNVSSVTDMSSMFACAGYNATLWDIGDISNWNVSNVTYITDMFEEAGYNATNFTELDLSGWNLNSLEDAGSAFHRTGGDNLTTIKTPYNISSNVNIKRITDKTFYDETDNYKEYPAGTFPTGITESHTLTTVRPEAYAAVYDGTQLVFGKALDIPETYTYTKDGVEVVGTLSEGWTNVESLNPSSKDDVPWIANYASTIKNVEVVDEISPIRTLCWFIDMRYCETMNLAKLDMSNVENMSRMFYNTGYNASSLTIAGLSEWDVSNATNMYSMFYNTGRESTKLDIGDISNWNVSNVTNMNSMFRQTGAKATNFTELDLSSWNVSNVTDMTKMLYKTGDNYLTVVHTPYNIPSTANITDITSKKFYDENDDYKEYPAGTFPVGITESHTLTTAGPVAGSVAYAAVYDGTQLVFGKATSVPVTYTYTNADGVETIGTLTESWTGIETLQENVELENIEDYIPWYDYNHAITDVNIVDKISPISTVYWFSDFINCSSMELSKLNTSNVTNMDSMFGYCSSLTELDLSNFNTSNVTNMSCMFDGCSSLTELDVSNFDTSNVTNMSCMFYGCSSLTELDVSNFDTSNVTSMGHMFYDCSSLTELDLSNFDTSNVTNMGLMFYDCSSLTELDLSNFDTSNATYMGDMFYDCSSLTELDLSNFNTSNVTNMSGMFKKCENLITIHTPYNISSTANIRNITSKTFYDVDDNYKEYPAGTFPVGITESHTLTTVKPTQSVTYNIDNNVSYTENVVKGTSALSPTAFTPSKDGYEFLGWAEDTTASSSVLTSKTVADSDIDLYAVFRKGVTLYTYDSKNRYEQTGTVYYNNGNIKEAKIITHTCDGYNNYSLLGYERFSSLNELESNCSANDIQHCKENATLILTDDTYLVSKYELNATLYCYDNSTTAVAKNTTKTYYAAYNNLTSYGSFTVPSQVAKSGWTTKGWATDASANANVAYSVGNTITNVTGDVYLYGLYEQPVTVTYYQVSNTTKYTDTKSKYYNSSGNIINPRFTINPTGYGSEWTFRGWTTSTEADAAPVYTSLNNTEISSNTTLYALLSQPTLLTYNGNGATGGSVATQTGTVYLNSYNGNIWKFPTVTLANNGFTRENYEFIGWDLGAPGTSIVLGGNMTATAQWEYRSYLFKDMTFNPAYGNVQKTFVTNTTYNYVRGFIRDFNGYDFYGYYDLQNNKQSSGDLVLSKMLSNGHDSLVLDIYGNGTTYVIMYYGNSILYQDEVAMDSTTRTVTINGLSKYSSELTLYIGVKVQYEDPLIDFREAFAVGLLDAYFTN